MSMYTAYFDASGHPDAPGAMFVSGFVSTVEKWLKFEKAWVTLLDDYSIENPFHMKDFAVGAKQYESWKDDKVARKDFYEKAIRIINRYTLKDFSQGIKIADFDRIEREYEIPPDTAAGMLSTPYTYCALSAFLEMVKWSKRRYLRKGKRVDGRMEFVYDRGEKHRGHFADTLQTLFGVSPIPRSAKEAVPIQAADILAWEHARAINDAGRGRPPRTSMQELSKRLPGSREWKFARYPLMVAYCEEQGFKKRNPGTAQ